MKKIAVQTAHLSWNEEGTPISEQFEDIYFSNQNGLEESRHVFLQGNQFPQRFLTHQYETCVIAETGFGTGLNFLALWQLFNQFKAENPHGTLQRLHFISFEKYPLSQQDLIAAHRCWPELADLSQQLCQQWPPALPGNHRIILENGSIVLDLWIGDVNTQISVLNDNLNNKIDAWFLDGFAPSKNPQMWSEHLFTTMAKLARSGGTFATFTVAGFVKRGLQQAGFTIKKIKGFGQKREMLTGILENNLSSITAPWFARQPASRTDDIAIVGGGLASLALANSLITRGANVTLYCQDQHVAQNASGNRQGAVYPLLTGTDSPLERFFVSGFPFATRFYHQLSAKGLKFNGEWCGVSQIAYNAKATKKINNMLQTEWPEEFAVGKDRRQLSELSGVDVNYGGIHYAMGGWLCPAQLCESFAQYLRQQGVTFCFDHQLTELTHTEQGWELTLNGEQKAFHQTVVLANGHQLNQFEQTKRLPITPVRGQVSHIPTNPTLQRLKNVLCFEGYLTPEDTTNGHHCLGASYQRDYLDMDYQEEEQQENLQKLRNSLPEVDWVQQVDISDKQSRQGIRCVIRDHLPLLGNVPDFDALMTVYENLPNKQGQQQTIPDAPVYPDLFIFGALGARGLSTAPLCAEILASQIFSEPLPADDEVLAALHPNRFWVRKLLAGRPITAKDA
ncbi:MULTISPECIES: bifunctional tRNA (5-methylaminomethyl-2-thiouridine)(34)-methyltransferase MnmD/FAD-dependent 5-carboxymethylaminomethyl-2-thiouridine(34) oxidoreductase MnmC [Providencia]|uniref:tRNA 5-methylaminomethyl-2-thiouridine biosynthesis bifunctional protein MnmC n=2 Tax=Providencia rustigianii TaxID=158850 RepID=D1P5R1_9GAMM|nr:MULTISPECIES: bifunctional tRNA (5-methylaminomethyl-2-thiouridine)(34)-methyltransferase MnmD/FAD-dependent 5-carboxymethylaminomethyl-2-thiouridine(34) oxidoreductase MnmC [Providencia]EFB71385.1 tRNA U-34 5-methylaminomethyl-2-thiouridine biosynthesis protein MnmC [Providencia rustigianii DSM 4541]SUC27579.1 tRNA 5-methylaminomethyl-2-thiouridine biosynthesis bifunctional protein MnmC [Providencia rustigianii]SUC36045.1 tRNA 5-methylaminomethyl-2-thiouridine biosynthesis bifunctional prote